MQSIAERSMKIWGKEKDFVICSVQFSVMFETLCNPRDCSTPGFPVLHHLLELAQTHVHWVSDAIQQYHSLSSPFPLQSFPASGSFPMNQLFALGGQSIGASASVLPMDIQGWFSLGLTALISLLSKALSRVFSSTRFEGINSSVLSLFYCPALTSVHETLRYDNRKQL